MAKWRCNSCGGTYFDVQRDGGAYFHACGAIPNQAYQPNPTLPNHDPRTHIEVDNPRDERPIPGLIYLDGKPHKQVPHFEERGTMLAPCDFAIMAEGKGRTQIE